MAAFYNEIDPHAAQWLRNLIAAGLIAPGVVDERSIEDIKPEELRGFTQCHFFAGVGVWSYALRLAGWPDDRPVWTGSCPCQPFSAAGQGGGFDDERHLWPHFHWLIAQHRPAIVLGEQVASRYADAWIDLVQDDLEGLGYAVGAVPFPSAGVGAPHIRDRLYWVADAAVARHGGREDAGAGGSHSRSLQGGRQGLAGVRESQRGGAARGLAHAASHGQRERQHAGNMVREAGAQSEHEPCIVPDGAVGRSANGHAGPTNGLWRAADWLLCRDGKWRPVEPGTFPLAHGAPARVGRLRAYGNAINAKAAQAFIEAYDAVRRERLGLTDVSDLA